MTTYTACSLHRASAGSFLCFLSESSMVALQDGCDYYIPCLPSRRLGPRQPRALQKGAELMFEPRSSWLWLLRLFLHCHIPLSLWTHVLPFFLAMPLGFWDLSSQPGIEPWPRQWKRRVLTIGPPGKSQLISFFLKSVLYWSLSFWLTSLCIIGALGRHRGIGWRGRWEGGSGWGIHVNSWLIHVYVWQKPLQYCKVISLQLIKINGKKKVYHICLGDGAES